MFAAYIRISNQINFTKTGKDELTLRDRLDFGGEKAEDIFNRLKLEELISQIWNVPLRLTINKLSLF